MSTKNFMKEFWRKQANIYGGANDLEEIIRNKVSDFVCTHARENGDYTVLEAGCGNGAIISKIISRGEDGIKKVVGIDSSPEMIEVAKQRIVNENITFSVDTVYSAVEPSVVQYDAFICCNTLHNLKDRASISFMLTHAHRAVCPGGRFLFDVRNSFNPFINFGYRKNRSAGLQFNTYSWMKAKRELEANGFVVEYVLPIHYNTLAEAGKKFGWFRSFLYSIYLKFTTFSLFSPYVLIVARKKQEQFVSVIHGYHKQLSSLSEKENYHRVALESALKLGYDVSVLSISGTKNIEEDMSFHKKISISYYTSLRLYVKFLWLHRKNIFYVNTFTWQSFLVPFLCRRAIFMGHDSVMRKTAIKRIIQKFIFWFFARIRVVTEDEKNYLVQQGIPARKIHVVPLAIDIEMFSSNKLSDRSGLVFLGNVTPDKNLPTILRALRIVADKLPNAQLTILGEVRDQEFTSLCQSLELEKNVVLSGFVPHKQLAEELQKYSICINSSYSEGQCLAVYEAALCGLGLCLPRTLSFKSVFDDRALFHEVSDHIQLAENIIQYMNDDALLKQHNAKAVEYIRKNYSTAVINDKELKLFTF